MSCTSRPYRHLTDYLPLKVWSTVRADVVVIDVGVCVLTFVFTLPETDACDATAYIVIARVRTNIGKSSCKCRVEILVER